MPSAHRRSSLRSPAVQPTRTLSLPVPAAHARRPSAHRVRFEGCQSRNGPAPRRASPWPARPSRIPCRVHSGGLARARPRSPAAARRAEGPRLRLSSCPLERTLVSEPHQRTLFLPVSRARHALSPCLSAPSTIRCSLSTREPGGCKQLLQRLSRPAPAQPPGPASLSHGKAYTLSPSWCSPSIHRAARKHTRPAAHRPANPILSVFLKNNGGYLDDSDEEEEGEDERGVDSARATVAFLRRIPHPFERRTRPGTPLSGSPSSDASASSRLHGSGWNRLHAGPPASPATSRSRLTLCR